MHKLLVTLCVGMLLAMQSVEAVPEQQPGDSETYTEPEEC